jgi:hypothetical protein
MTGPRRNPEINDWPQKGARSARKAVGRAVNFLAHFAHLCGKKYFAFRLLPEAML